VRRVNLQNLETGGQSAPCGRSKRFDNPADFLFSQRTRRCVIMIEGNGARCDWRPSALRFRDRSSAFPRTRRAGFAPGVRYLNSSQGALLANKTGDSRKKLDVLVLPDSKVVRADAALGRDCGCLGQYERRSANRSAPKVNQMPIVREPVDARVLAHWRHDDTVAERDVSKWEFIEDLHRNLAGEGSGFERPSVAD
jgi:hypothetical protein